MSDFFAKGIRAMACPHTELTPEDGTGKAICRICGAAIQVRLTREFFATSMRKVAR